MGVIEKGGLRFCHGLKCILRTSGQWKRGWKVLTPPEMCFEGMGAMEKGVRGVATS